MASIITAINSISILFFILLLPSLLREEGKRVLLCALASNAGTLAAL